MATNSFVYFDNKIANLFLEVRSALLEILI